MKLPEKGFFVGDAITKWLDNGRDMQLMSALSFVDRAGRVWRAPAGSIVDGASIPRICWRLIGSPFCGKYRRASIIHDAYCVARSRPWQDVHRCFNDMMAADGVGWLKRWAMFRAVYHFGPRW